MSTQAKGRISAVLAVLALLALAGPARAQTTVSKAFTNHTGATVNDLHWVFNTVETVNSIASDFFPTKGSSNDGSMTYIDYSGAGLMNGNSTTCSVTFNDSTSSEYSANWTLSGVNVGSAYTPMSYGSSWGAATQEWVVALDNKDIYGAWRLLVSGLSFALTPVQFDAQTLATANLVFGPPEPDFIIEPGFDSFFDVFTGSPDIFVVSQAQLSHVDDLGNPIPYHESMFRGQVVPEPVSLVLLAAGGCALLRRRRG